MKGILPMRKALALLLALSLPACGVGSGAQGPYIPPASVDMAQPPALEPVQPGPDSSGGDVRLLWVKTAGGARVRLGQKVHAVELSKAVGVPVQCAFEESGVLGQYACAPTGPVVASVLPYFTDSACQSRLYWETPEYRSCISPEPMIGVWYSQPLAATSDASIEPWPSGCAGSPRHRSSTRTQAESASHSRRARRTATTTPWGRISAA